MAGKFEVYEDRAGKFRFRLKASNGQVVAVGEAYETRVSAHNGCRSLMAAAGVPREVVTASGVDSDADRAAAQIVDI